MFKQSLPARILSLAGPSVILLWIGGGFLAVLRLIPPAQIGKLTDLMSRDATASTPRGDQVWWIIVSLLAAHLAIALIGYWSQLQMTDLRERLGRNLTLELLRRLVRFAPQYFRDHDAETINARVLDNTRSTAEFAAEAIVIVPLAALSLCIFGGVMLSTNWFLGCCTLPLALLSGYFLVFDRQIQQINREHRRQWEEIRSASHELIAGVREVRVQGAFDYGVQRIASRLGKFRNLIARSGRWSALFHVGEPFVAAVQNGAVYWLGAGLCLSSSSLAGQSDRMTWGNVIQFLLVMQLFADPVQRIAGFLLKWRMSHESLQRVRELWSESQAFEDPEMTQPASATLRLEPSDFQFNQVDVTTPSGTRILHGIQAHLLARRHAGIVGTAGCGKSTLLQLMMRGVAPSAGQVLLDNRDIATWDMRQLARSVGFVDQHPVIFAASIRDNILLSLRRPSAHTCEVGGELVDVSPWEHVTSPGEVDERILDVARQLDFEADLFQKGLNSVLADSSSCPTLRARILELRQAVRNCLQPADSPLIIRFHRDAYCREATLGENLLGFNSNWPTPFRRPERSRLFDCLEEAGLLDEILALGSRRLQEERQLAAKLSLTAKRLRELLRTSCLHAELAAGENLARLRHLDWESKATLVQLAFESPAAFAAEQASHTDWGRRVVGARQSLLEDAPIPPAGAYWPSDAGYEARLTLRENLLFGRINEQVFRASKEIDRLLYSVLRDADVLDEVLVVGLDYQVGEGGNRLSGGQRQKVALARVLLKRPAMLLLDEATSNLDEISQRRVTDLLKQEFAGHTVVAVSHRLSTVRDCEQILVLDQGLLVQRGTYESLAATQGLFQQLVLQESGVAPPLHGPEPASVPMAADQSLLRGLTACRLFADLNSECLAILARSARIQTCPKGTVLFERGDSGEELYVILSGEVEFFVHPPDMPGRVEVVDVYRAGQAFGELALLGSDRRTLGAQARSDLRLCLLRRADLLTVIELEPRIGIALLRTLAQRLASLRDEQYGPASQAACRE